jgi:hypothetical protein
MNPDAVQQPINRLKPDTEVKAHLILVSLVSITLRNPDS